MHHYATPHDIAQMMLFLASDESRHCTGSIYMVRGLRLVTTRGNCLADRLFGGFDAIVQEECEKRILADELSG
jgi:hypothetical protein